MSDLLASGTFLDVVLACMLVELIALLLLRRRGRRGPTMIDLLPGLAAGALLVLAMRTVWVGGHWIIAAGLLCASLSAHSFDLVRRWR